MKQKCFLFAYLHEDHIVEVFSFRFLKITHESDETCFPTTRLSHDNHRDITPIVTKHNKNTQRVYDTLKRYPLRLSYQEYFCKMNKILTWK